MCPSEVSFAVSIRTWLLVFGIWLERSTNYEVPITNYRSSLPQTSPRMVQEQVFQARFRDMHVAQLGALGRGRGHDCRHQCSATVGIDVGACPLYLDIAHTGQ